MTIRTIILVAFGLLLLGGLIEVIDAPISKLFWRSRLKHVEREQWQISAVIALLGEKTIVHRSDDYIVFNRGLVTIAIKADTQNRVIRIDFDSD
jgi:hypothetical protein